LAEVGAVVVAVRFGLLAFAVATEAAAAFGSVSFVGAVHFPE
jgi:hypothetical protein